MSVSVPDDILARIDAAAKKSHPGRSAFVREALQHYLDDLEKESDLAGPTDALLVISHDHDGRSFSALRHEHESLIRAHLHQDAHDRCHELLLVNGSANAMRRLLDDARQRTFHARWVSLR